jgi:hypothetical protein
MPKVAAPKRKAAVKQDRQFIKAGTVISPKRTAEKQDRIAKGITSGKTHKRELKKNRVVQPQFYKDGTMVPTKRKLAV